MNYRPEIDGLRTIAVLPVILFHAGFSLFKGGFVGVDVFFVISGYLITTILINELENKKFSIINFYERRARRILPALFFVIVVCIPFSWMWMEALQFKEFSNSLIAVSLFISNMLFWREQGYFSTASEEKPLLHTWSLAVEEQYYILFPIFLALVWKYGKNRVFIFALLIAAISLLLSEWGWRHSPSANFYFLPTRAWELLAGSLSALLASNGAAITKSYKSSNVLSALGLVCIGVSIFLYDESIPFPSFYTLLPVLGTVFVLLFSNKETYVNKILSNKVFVSLGLISYSAYLWHQPLFAFARMVSTSEPTSMVMITLIISTLVLATISYNFVEKPFRNKKSISRKFILRFSSLALLMPILIGYLGHIHNGFLQKSVTKTDFSNVEKQLKENIYVVGDSHAGHLVKGLKIITEGNVFNYSGAGCIPFRNVDRYDSRFVPGTCSTKMNAYLDEILLKDPTGIVLLSTMGPVYLDGTTFNGKDKARVTGLGVKLITNKSINDRWKVFEIGLRTTLEELSSLKNSKVVFAIDVPELGYDFGCDIERKAIRLGDFTIEDSLGGPSKEECFVSRAAYDERSQRYKEFVKNIVSEYPKIGLFDPTDLFCNSLKCKGFDQQYGYLYHDFDHLNKGGSLIYAQGFVEYLKKNTAIQ